MKRGTSLKIQVAVAGVIAAGVVAFAPRAQADEADARRILKNMSDYLAKQKMISFKIDTSLDVVTTEHQRLSIANSGTLRMVRPDKIQVTRTGGFADSELIFDGKTLTLVRRDQKLYSQLEIPGSIDNLVEVLRDKYQRPLPAADLILSDVYKQLMDEVVNVKDLGSGYIRGVECDHFAFRTTEVDWQIWIAQGSRPIPMRFSIVSQTTPGTPQYVVDIMNFKTGRAAAISDFKFVPPVGAREVQPSELKSFDELPEIYKPKN